MLGSIDMQTGSVLREEDAPLGTRMDAAAARHAGQNVFIRI